MIVYLFKSRLWAATATSVKPMNKRETSLEFLPLLSSNCFQSFEWISRHVGISSCIFAAALPFFDNASLDVTL